MTDNRNNVIGIRRHVHEDGVAGTSSKAASAAIADDDSTAAGLDEVDTTPHPDVTVHPIEHAFDLRTADSTEESGKWQAGTETSNRSPARRPASTTNPTATTARRSTKASEATRQSGSRSLGVLMPTLLPSKPTFTGRNTTDVGYLAHALIGSHVQFLSPKPTPTAVLDIGHQEANTSGLGPTSAVPSDLLQRMYAVAYSVIDANANATRVLATEAASFAFRYLTTFPPSGPWSLLGVEYDTGAGEVDIAWIHGTTGAVFFDEVKTSRVTSGRRVPDQWVQQCRRYSTAGSDRFGDLFLGTRLLPLMATNTARLVIAGLPVQRLNPTATDPLRPADELRSRS